MDRESVSPPDTPSAPARRWPLSPRRRQGLCGTSARAEKKLTFEALDWLKRSFCSKILEYFFRSFLICWNRNRSLGTYTHRPVPGGQPRSRLREATLAGSREPR